MVVNQKEAILGLDPQSGTELWRYDAIEDYVVPCVSADGETLYCSGSRSNKTFAVRDGEKLFLATRDAGVLVIAAEPVYRELAVNSIGSPDERFSATPTIVNGQILLRSDITSYCIAENAGT